MNFTHPNNPLPIDAEDPTEVTTGDRFAQACQWISAVFFQGPPFDDDENDSGNFASMAAGLLNSRTLYTEWRIKFLYLLFLI